MPRTVYDPKFCQVIIDYMSTGRSVTAAAQHIGVTRQTLYDWDVHPEWKEAFALAREGSCAYYEQQLEEMAQDPSCKSNPQYKALEFLLASRHRDIYSKNTSSQQIDINLISKMSTEDIDAQIQRLLTEDKSLRLDYKDAIDGEVIEND